MYEVAHDMIKQNMLFSECLNTIDTVSKASQELVHSIIESKSFMIEEANNLNEYIRTRYKEFLLNKYNLK